MSKRILAVDDSKTIQQMVSFTLEEAGYDVTIGGDGQQGLDALEAGEFDVIITDVNMPVMDGLTFISKVRAQPKYAGMPILVLTTDGSEKTKMRGREVGATGWIVKPFDPEKLLAVISKVSP